MALLSNMKKIDSNSFLPRFLDEAKTQDNFNQQMVCKAPIGWLKYTTLQFTFCKPTFSLQFVSTKQDFLERVYIFIWRRRQSKRRKRTIGDYSNDDFEMDFNMFQLILVSSNSFFILSYFFQ